MDDMLKIIREVQEGGKKNTNYYLSHGYILLDIQASTRAQHLPAGGNEHGHEFYIRKNPIYVVGRPEGVEPVEPPPRGEAPAGGEK